jgi:hypothetical protein
LQAELDLVAGSRSEAVEERHVDAEQQCHGPDDADDAQDAAPAAQDVGLDGMNDGDVPVESIF